MATLRILVQADAASSAALHRRSRAVIPGYDVTLHTPEEDLAFHRDTLIAKGDSWGLFEQDRLLGFMTLSPGWIDQLYVDPDHLGSGFGTRLLDFAKSRQGELRLHTFQSNQRARRFYERHGFVIEAMSDGHRNEEGMPDLTYCWRRG